MRGTGTSLFDVNTFLETQHAITAPIDTTYVLPDEKDYRAETSDKILSQSGVVSEGDYAGNAWARVELQWELHDDAMKKKLNMDRVLVRQNIMLDLLQDEWKKKNAIVLDMGINKNMRLKRLLDATGLATLKAWNFNMLKHQAGLVTVAHRRIDGFDDPIAEVVRVTSIKKAPPL